MAEKVKFLFATHACDFVGLWRYRDPQHPHRVGPQSEVLLPFGAEGLFTRAFKPTRSDVAKVSR